MEKIKWAICDDAEYERFIYKMNMEKYPELELVNESSDSAECLSGVVETMPDVLLLDIQLETDYAGIDIISALKEKAPNMGIIIISSHDDEEYIFKAFALGASDYILKDQPFEVVYKKIKDTYHQQNSVDTKIVQSLVKKASDIESTQISLLYAVEIMTKLSVAELEVLKAIYLGKSYKTIADERFVSESTIKVLASRILKKFGYSSMKNVVKHLREIRVFDLFSK